MINQHFLKSLILFTLMIIVGLVGIFLVGHYSANDEAANSTGISRDCPKELCEMN